MNDRKRLSRITIIRINPNNGHFFIENRYAACAFYGNASKALHKYPLGLHLIAEIEVEFPTACKFVLQSQINIKLTPNVFGPSDNIRPGRGMEIVIL